MNFIQSLWETYGSSVIAVAYFLAFCIFMDFVVFKWKKSNPDKSYRGKFITSCIVILLFHWIGWI